MAGLVVDGVMLDIDDTLLEYVELSECALCFDKSLIAINTLLHASYQGNWYFPDHTYQDKYITL